MNIKLANSKAIILEEMPEVIDLHNDGVSITLSNFEEVKNKLILTLEYDGTYTQIKIREPNFTIPVSLLMKDLTRVSFACFKGDGFVSYNANPEKFKIKGLINIEDSDKLIDLLTVLYQKYVELDAKYNELDKIVNQGDLLI